MDGIALDYAMDATLSANDIVIYKPNEVDKGALKIGRGAFGIITRVLINNKLMAVKSFKRGNFARKDESSLFRSLHLIFELTEHPNILRYSGVVVDDGFLIAAVMPLMENGDLYTAITDRKLKYTTNCIFGWAAQMCKGLEFLHNNNIVHRDVKPHNMVLSEKYSVLKLCDLDGARKPAADKTMTTFCGTKLFSAQEVKSGKYGLKSDMVGIGVTLWMLATRESPVMFKLKVTELPDINLVKNPFIKRTAQGCWAGNPELRLSAEVVAKQYSALFKSKDGYRVQGNIYDCSQFVSENRDEEDEVDQRDADSERKCEASIVKKSMEQRKRILSSEEKETISQFIGKWTRNDYVSFNGTARNDHGPDGYQISFKFDPASPAALLFEWGNESAFFDFGKPLVFKILPPNKIAEHLNGEFMHEFWIENGQLFEHFVDFWGKGWRCSYENEEHLPTPKPTYGESSSLPSDPTPVVLSSPTASELNETIDQKSHYSPEMIGSWRRISFRKFSPNKEWDEGAYGFVVSWEKGPEHNNLIYQYSGISDEWKLNVGPKQNAEVLVNFVSLPNGGVQKTAQWPGGTMSQKFFIQNHQLYEEFDENGSGWKCIFERVRSRFLI